MCSSNSGSYLYLLKYLDFFPFHLHSHARIHTDASQRNGTSKKKKSFTSEVLSLFNLHIDSILCLVCLLSLLTFCSSPKYLTWLPSTFKRRGVVLLKTTSEIHQRLHSNARKAFYLEVMYNKQQDLSL